MSATHIHFIINAISWIVLYVFWILFGVFQWYSWSQSLSWLFPHHSLLDSFFQFSLGGIIYDLDHFLYYGTTTKPLTIKNIKQRMQYDYAHSNPHFYVCHTIEFIIIILTCSIYFKLSLLLISISGWFLHMIIDSTDYIRLYKSHKPWLPYFSMISFLFLALKESE